MKRLCILCLIVSFSFSAQKIRYVTVPDDSVFIKLDSIRELEKERQMMSDDSLRKIFSNETDDRKLIVDFPDGQRPGSPRDFRTIFHFKPAYQGYTGTCWAHSVTSLIESETWRKRKLKIKLSVMHTVYYEYLEKCLHFVRTRGEFEPVIGSQGNAVFEIAEKYGMVPESVYDGNRSELSFDYRKMRSELINFLEFCRDNNFWNENAVKNTAKAILDRHMGPVPANFPFRGRSCTPMEFYKEILKFNPHDYLICQSTLSIPFYEEAEFAFPDNWRHSENFMNLPLNEFYEKIKSSVKKGRSVSIGGDVSEPGYRVEEDIAFVPDIEIPSGLIDQESREYRIWNKTTGDDHLIHIVGYCRMNDQDWFLIKDSSRKAWAGKNKGYMFYSGDFIRLKMLNAIIQK